MGQVQTMNTSQTQKEHRRSKRGQGHSFESEELGMCVLWVIHYILTVTNNKAGDWKVQMGNCNIVEFIEVPPVNIVQITEFNKGM